MDEQFEMNENELNDDVETLDEFYEDSEDSGLIGKVLVGGATIAAGAAVGFAIKNRDKIKTKFADLKEARKAKKVAKLMDKLNKLAPQEPKTEEAEKKE